MLKDTNFGELFVGNYKPESLDQLFISVQTLNSQALHTKLPADYYDYIVIDETHHAAAHSYGKALEHFQPRVLLGLTATPERMDGKSMLSWCLQGRSCPAGTIFHGNESTKGWINVCRKFSLHI